MGRQNFAIYSHLEFGSPRKKIEKYRSNARVSNLRPTISYATLFLNITILNNLCGSKTGIHVVRARVKSCFIFK